MDATTKTRLARYVRYARHAGYPAFFLLAFVAMLYLTLPYQVIAEQLAAAGRSAGFKVVVGSIGPGLARIRAKGVRITPPKQEGQTAEPEALVIEELSFRPTLFPMGTAFAARLFGGTAEGSVGMGSKPFVTLKLKTIDLARINAKAVFGLDVGGKLNLAVNVASSEPVSLGPRGLEYDASKLSGSVGLAGDTLAINGGTVANYDLPKVDLGRLDAVVRIEPGKVDIATFRTEGGDAESSLEGQIALQKMLAVSTLRLKLKFKPSDDFLKRNSFIQTGLSFAMTRDPKGYYAANIERTIGNPRFAPVR